MRLWDKMAIASGVRWFGHVLIRDENDVRCFKRGVAVLSGWTERKRTTKKYMEKASRERNAKGWFEKRGWT